MTKTNLKTMCKKYFKVIHKYYSGLKDCTLELHKEDPTFALEVIANRVFMTETRILNGETNIKREVVVGPEHLNDHVKEFFNSVPGVTELSMSNFSLYKWTEETFKDFLSK